MIEFRSEMSVELIDHMGSDASVVRAARVSTRGSESRGEQADKGLINYLVREGHGSPLEHSAFTFLVEAPIFVARQMMRHRMASYNEHSGRYSEHQPEFYLPTTRRPVVQEGKPGAYTYVQGTDEQHDLVQVEIRKATEASWYAYRRMIEHGIAREVARMAIPTNIYTAFFVTLNLRSLLNFLSLRSDEEGLFPSFPQEEIVMVARKMEAVLAERMPLAHAAFVKQGRVAP